MEAEGYTKQGNVYSLDSTNLDFIDSGSSSIFTEQYLTVYKRLSRVWLHIRTIVEIRAGIFIPIYSLSNRNLGRLSNLSVVMWLVKW